MRTYLHVFSLGIQTSLEYRSDLYLSLFSTVFPTILQLYIWQAIYTSPDMVYQGYTYPQIVLYSLMSGLVTKLTSCGFEYRIGEDIKSGGLNKFIVRPVNYVFYCFFEFDRYCLTPFYLYAERKRYCPVRACRYRRAAFEFPDLFLYCGACVLDY